MDSIASLSVPPALLRKLESLAGQLADLDSQLSDSTVLVDHKKVRDLSIKKAAIEGVVADYRVYLKAAAEAAELQAAISAGEDKDFVEMARAELPQVLAAAEGAIERAKGALVNADDRSIGSVMMEVRAGTGGDEASLSAPNLIYIYSKYAARTG